jgi:hypothetical protein
MVLKHELLDMRKHKGNRYRKSVHTLANSTREFYAETLHYCIELGFIHTVVVCVLRRQTFPIRTPLISTEVCFRNARAIFVACDSQICKTRTCAVIF